MNELLKDMGRRIYRQCGGLGTSGSKAKEYFRDFQTFSV